MPDQTPSQTVGPYFAIGLYSNNPVYPRIVTGDMATPDVAGRRIRIEGIVFDGAGEPVPDCMIEVWQADGEGHYRTGERQWNDGFTGFGRVGPDETARIVINTVMPGQVPAPGGGLQAPHLTLVVFSRGLLVHAYTRVYIDDQGQANAADPVLQIVPSERRATLIAGKQSEGVYRFDIRLQGDDETVFFDV